MKLPDCMMPDGAEPCKGYQELYAYNEKITRQRDLFKKLLDRHPLCPGCRGKYHGAEECQTCRAETAEAKLKVAVEALERIAEHETDCDGLQAEMCHNVAEQALAKIGGD